MPSRLPGYTYDVFISYRQKDNLPQDRETTGWVTEFVARLKQEIQSTIKEDVNIYFDENPFDGILSTHDVDDSVKNKIKCLILIPIVSQIYCDPRSFAWNNEFLAFKSFCNNDTFGLKVQLLNGNVASRILPVCIHELDAQDHRTIEAEVGPLRSVDFIFKAPGVNRPLTPSDKREDTPSRIIYKDQINKVANGIKDVVKAMEAPTSGKIHDDDATNAPKSRTHVRPKMAIVFGAALLLLVAISSIVYFTKKGDSVIIAKSIAVLPFVDMSSGKDLEYLGDGIAEEIINSLTSIGDLRIIGRTSSFQFKGEKLDLREIGEKLNVATILEGSIQQFDNKMRITAQLIRTSDNSHIWSKRYDVEQTDIFKIQDNIASSIVQLLNITLSSQEQGRLVKKETTKDAYTTYLKGLFQYKKENFADALRLFEDVIAVDSLYAPAHAYWALSKAWTAINSKAKDDDVRTIDAIRSAERALRLDPTLPEGYSCLALIAWAIERDVAKSHRYFEKSLELDPGSSLIKNRYCYFLTWMGDFDKAERLANEAMSIDPLDYNSYAVLYFVNFYSGKLKNARTYKKELASIVGRNHRIVSMDIELNLYEGNFKRVNQICDSLVSTGSQLWEDDLSYKAMAYYSLGQRDSSNKYLYHLTGKERLLDNSNYIAARVYAYRHETDSTFSNLNRAMRKWDIGVMRLKIDPAFKDLTSDPRYISLYNSLGFDNY